MAEFKVMTNNMKTAIEELRSLNEQFKSAVSELEETEASLNTMWEGTAKDTFHNAFTTDADKMELFYTTIETYAAALETIRVNYIQAESRNIETAATRTYL